MSASSIKYLFLLGSFPELSWLELQSVLPQSLGLQRLSNFVAGTRQLPKLESDSTLLSVLGGTVKIAEVLNHYEKPSQSELEQDIIDYLSKSAERSEFGIAEWGRDHLPKIDPKTIKDSLVESGISSRYRTGARSGLSAAILLHQEQTEEVVVCTYDGGTVLAKTIAVQNIDQWHDQDRNKPFAERKRGLLPPKVARMMLCVALGSAVLDSTSTSESSLWDPFCGSGTIPFESLLLAVKHVYGSDIDQDSILGSYNNLAWFSQRFSESIANESTCTFFQADATNIVEAPFGEHSITHLVTEPFLGKPSPPLHTVSNIRTGLERMYKGMFKEWRKWLAPNAHIVCVFPRWHFETPQGSKTFRLDSLFDFLKSIGYTIVSEPVLYARPGAVVQREIYHLQYQS